MPKKPMVKKNSDALARTVVNLLHDPPLKKVAYDPEKAEKVRRAYQPVRDDSTVEFTVQHIATLDGGAMAFGLVTKGTLHEGYRLHLIRDTGEQKECMCRAIAGATKRLFQASSESVHRYIGIWLDIPPSDLKAYDRLISFDNPPAARQVTPISFQFSILSGVQK